MPTTPDTAVVRFIKPHAQYNIGEAASFPLAFCLKAVKDQYAVFVDADLAAQHSPAAKAPPVMNTQTHSLTVEQCIKLIAALPTVPAVEQLWEGEKHHPNFSGGRAGVLNALRARAQELTDADAQPK